MLYMDSIKNLMVRIANRLKDTMLRRKLMLLVVVLIVGLIISAIIYNEYGLKSLAKNSHKTSVVSTYQTNSPLSNETAQTASIRWLIASSAVGYINLAAGNNNFAQTIFNHSYDYEITAPNVTSTDILPQSIKVLSYKSYAAFQADVSNKSIPAGYPVLMYDNESWTYTPPNEQQNPMLYYQKFGQLAHSLGYKVLATPAADLTSVLLPKTDKYSGYLQLNLAKTARFADIFNIQAQNSSNSQAYTSFVESAIQQIKQVNPNAVILTGLTIRLNGPSLSTVENEYNATKNLVNGYWLNVISHNRSNNATVGKMAIEFLNAIKA